MKGTMSNLVTGLAGKTAFVVAASSLLGGAGTVAHAATVRAASWPTTASQAQKEWPGARLVKLGAELHAGRYIFKDRTGHYDLLSVSFSVSALRGHTQSAQQRAMVGSYCMGCVYEVTANVSVSSFLWGTQWLNTTQPP